MEFVDSHTSRTRSSCIYISFLLELIWNTQKSLGCAVCPQTDICVKCAVSINSINTYPPWCSYDCKAHIQL